MSWSCIELSCRTMTTAVIGFIVIAMCRHLLDGQFQYLWHILLCLTLCGLALYGFWLRRTNTGRRWLWPAPLLAFIVAASLFG